MVRGASAPLLRGPTGAGRLTGTQHRRGHDGGWNAGTLRLDGAPPRPVKRDPVLPVWFGEEARASLPVPAAERGVPNPDDVFFTMGLQRLRLRHEQQVPEWAG
jgi:hypothetical protein